MTETIVIKLKPMLQDFLVTIMEDTPQHKKIREKVRRFIKVALKPTPPNYVPDFKRDQDHVEIAIPRFDIGFADNRGNIYLDEYAQREFENQLDDELKSALYLFMDIYLRYNRYSIKRRGVIKKGIYAFFDEYRINPEKINYEMCKKNYYRYRMETGDYMPKKVKKVSRVLSSNCPLIFLL